MFAKENDLLGMKALTVNHFGNRVSTKEVHNLSTQLSELIVYMEELGYTRLKSECLNIDTGLMMIVLSDDRGHTISFVDHRNDNTSLTSVRTYSPECHNCINGKESFPSCDTGIMSLILQVDGMLSYCRLRQGVSIAQT